MRLWPTAGSSWSGSRPRHRKDQFTGALAPSFGGRVSGNRGGQPPKCSSRRAVEWQPDIVFRQGSGPGARSRHVVELRELNPVLERVRLVESVEHGGHPPRESLRLPNSAKRGRRIAV